MSQNFLSNIVLFEDADFGSFLKSILKSVFPFSPVPFIIFFYVTYSLNNQVKMLTGK